MDLLLEEKSWRGRRQPSKSTEQVESQDIAVTNQDTFSPQQYRQLIRIVRGTRAQLRERVEQWRLEQSQLLPSIDILAQWVSGWLLVKGGHSSKVLSPKTIYSFLNAMGTRLVGLLGSHDPTAFGREELVSLYQSIIEHIGSAGVRKRVRTALYSWHRFLVKHHGAQAISISDISTSSSPDGVMVDANVISPSDFLRAQRLLYDEVVLRQRDIDLAEVLCIMMSIGFYLGLRRSEVLGLLVEDCIGEVDLYLRVEPNKVRGLKTDNSIRMIPASVMMPEQQLACLKSWLGRRRVEVKQQAGQFLFPGFQLETKVLDTDRRLNWIRESLQRVTGDHTFRFHHLRHSCGNWLLLRFAIYEMKKSGLVLPEWFLPDQESKEYLLETAPLIRESLLGTAPTNRRSLMQVSRILGHISSGTTLHSYLHLMDLLLGIYVHRMMPNVDKQFFQTLLGHKWSVIADADVHTSMSSHTSTPLKSARLLEHGCERQARESLYDSDTDNGRMEIRPEERLQIISTALLLLQTKTVDEVAAQLQVDAKRIRKWASRYRELPDGITVTFLKNRYTNSISVPLDLPRGKSQRTHAIKAATILDQLRREGDPPQLMVQATQNRVRKVIESLPSLWVEGKPFTIRTGSLQEAKRWIWLLIKLEMPLSTIVVEHSPLIEGTTLKPEKQHDYWSKKLGGLKVYEKVRDACAIQKNGPKKGVVDIRVKSEAIAPINKGNNEMKDRSGVLLDAIRLALIAEWLDES